MKRLISLLVAIAMCLMTIPDIDIIASASTESPINIGDCITLGNYNGEPIVWRCVDIDDNGPLMLSEDVLCDKEFDAPGDNPQYHSDSWGYIRKGYGSNNWQDSNIRQWLNSAGTVEYSHCPPSYSSEAGFMSNFTEQELCYVKTVSHTVTVVKYDSTRTGYCDGGSSDSFSINPISKDFDINKYYHKTLEDMFMLLDVNQIKNIYYSHPEYLMHSSRYFTACTGGNNYACFNNVRSFSPNSTTLTGTYVAHEALGIRPAFYLDLENFEGESSTDFTYPISPEHLLSSSWESQAITIMDDYLATATSAPDWIVRSYQSNPKFMVGAAGWEYMNFLAEPSSTATDLLNKKSYYTTIILNLLNSYISSDGVIEMMKSNVVTDTAAIASNFTKIIQQCDELEWEAILNGAPFTLEDIDVLLDRAEKIDTANIHVSVIQDVLKHAASFEECCGIAANYIGLTRVKDDMIVMLEQLKANTSDLYYKYALQETIDSIESTFSAYLLGVQNGVANFATDKITDYADDAWQEVLKSNPYTAAALFGFKIGKPLTNMLMDTDATISNYYDFLALREVERSVIASFKHFRDEFYADTNETTSVNYIRAVSMYFSVQYICCDYVEAFNEIANQCPFAQLFYSRQESYESLATTWKETRASVKNLEYSLFRLWVLELKEQYPEIYSEISDTVGDIYSTDLKNATVTAEYFSVEYTGEMFCPSVSVKINGSPLIEGLDYSVEYKDNVEVGRAKIIITPAEGSMFSGQAIGGFVISAPPFTKRYSLKDTGARINTYSLRSAMRQLSSDANKIPNVIVYNKEGTVVAAVENGEITCHILPVVIYGDDVDIFMDSEEYIVDITSANATTSHVELSSLDENGAVTDSVVYTGIPNNEISHNIYSDSDELIYDNITLEPTYTSKTQDENTANGITVKNGVALQETAFLGEVIYIDATIGANQKFLGWSSNEVVLNAPSEATTYFIMGDQSVTISADLALAGDVDRNDILDTSDVRLTLKKIVGLTETFTYKQNIITDMNEDNKINSADVRRMLLMIASES